MCVGALQDIKYDPRELFLENSLNFHWWTWYTVELFQCSIVLISTDSIFNHINHQLLWNCDVRAVLHSWDVFFMLTLKTRLRFLGLLWVVGWVVLKQIGPHRFTICYAITYKEGVWHNMDSTEICRPVLSVWGGWVFKQISANMGYHVRHHVANPLIPTPPSRYNKMI